MTTPPRRQDLSHPSSHPRRADGTPDFSIEPTEEPHRRTPDPNLLPSPSSLPMASISSIENLSSVQVKEHEQSIALSNGTKATCTECGREDAPFLFLKKSNGLYKLLCKDFDASGCWPQSSRTLCNFADHRGVQCTLLAEFKLQCGADPIRTYNTCNEHVGMFLQSYTEYKLYPLDKD
jgi:hypothetical protein